MIEKKTLISSTFEQEAAVAPYRCVKLGTAANEVSEAASAAALIVGISDETASDTINEEVAVIMQGITKLEMLAASTKGGAVTGTTDGKGVVTTTAADFCAGWLLKTTTVANELAPVLVNPFIYAIT